MLKENPDWHAAAQSLVGGCVALDSIEARVRLLESVCNHLGEHLYPAFLQILYVVAECGDKEAQTLVTDTLVHAITTGRLPSGKLFAWGANTIDGDGAFGQTRSLGPIEYLCAWYSQSTGRQPLSAHAFQNIMQALLELISSNHCAKSLYCTKLSTDIEDPLGGSLSSQTRKAIGVLVSEWRAGKPAAVVVDAYLNTLQGNSIDRLANIKPLFRGT